MAAPTNPCEREDSPCQLGAVHTWHYCDIVLCRLEFRFWRLSGRVATVPRGPGLTHCGPHMAQDGSLFGHRGFVKPLDGPWDKALRRRASNASLHRTSSHHHTTTPPNTPPRHSHALGRPWGVVAAKLG